MKKNHSAKRPPMGWNSYDQYDTTVTEAEIRASADTMANQLKPYGWEYIVVDIQWYSALAGTRRKQWQYIPFEDLPMDEFGRLQPAVSRFPSSANGAGFAPLAAYVHEKGLKFGIHIMRGIPRQAVHRHMPILGSEQTADLVALPSLRGHSLDVGGTTATDLPIEHRLPFAVNNGDDVGDRDTILV